MLEMINNLRGLRPIRKIDEKIKNVLKNQGGWGIAEVLTIIVSVVIVAVVLAPALKTLAGDVTTSLSTWWDGIKTTIFTSA